MIPVLVNVLTYRGVLNPQSLIGLRRRQSSDSDSAWRACLRAAVPCSAAPTSMAPSCADA
ncbi:hypothetical protein [Cryobacterium sp. Hh11]|uniref:hypothetical protein n=1 Tax=Cryobacterium sp. Hh11 TaxID=2555868 RepID=UPI001A7E4A5E|nr:hypothetical protein [Cryobacterium sp. Hh11]